MILSDREMLEFEAAARPLVKWLNDNCHPMVVAIVKPSRAELLEGVYSVNVTDYIKERSDGEVSHG